MRRRQGSGRFDPICFAAEDTETPERLTEFLPGSGSVSAAAACGQSQDMKEQKQPEDVTVWSLATSNRTPRTRGKPGNMPSQDGARRTAEAPTVGICDWAGGHRWRGGGRGGHATTWIRLENIMLSERSQAQRIS